MSKKISHCLFDVDGLLIDTETLYSVIMTKICEEYGKVFTPEIKRLQMGKITKDGGQAMIDALNLPITWQQYAEKLAEHTPHIFPQATLMPGAEKIIRHLSKHNIPIAIATSSAKSPFDYKTTNHKEVFSLFHHIVCGNDPELKNGKPAPDIYLISMSRFPKSPKPENVLVFEDARNGVLSGLSAGCSVLWAVDKRYTIPDEDLIKKESNRLKMINSLEEFDPTYYGFPAYD